MKSQPPAKDSSEKASSSPSRPTQPARRDPAKPRGSEYDLSVSYYCTMKPQRVYPLVVEVPRGRGAVPADGPTGVTVTLRPAVPGAVVVPAELPLEVSRPGAAATFHVTPLARGRLREACVRVLYDGRPVQELRTRMTGKTQRLAWLLLLLALVVPPLLVHWTVTDPMRGRVPRLLLKPDRKEGDAEKPPAADTTKPPAQPPLPEPPPPPRGGKPGGPAAPPLQPLEESPYEEVMQMATPGEVLTYRLGLLLRDNLPEFPGRTAGVNGLAAAAGAVYGTLCGVASDLRLGFWLGVLLLSMAFGSWVLHRPTRVRRLGSVALPAVASGPTLRAAETGETLPLAHRELE